MAPCIDECRVHTNPYVPALSNFAVAAFVIGDGESPPFAARGWLPRSPFQVTVWPTLILMQASGVEDTENPHAISRFAASPVRSE